jgi:hypothetical protein
MLGASQPSFIVNDIELPREQREEVGIWIESGTIAHFRNLKIGPKR